MYVLTVADVTSKVIANAIEVGWTQSAIVDVLWLTIPVVPLTNTKVHEPCEN